MLLVVMATSQNSLDVIVVGQILVIEVLLIATRCGPPT
jgi:hypothetical protein